MQILLINNDGGGFADHITIADGMTVQRLFAERLPHANAADYLIRVNRLPVTGGQILCEADRVSITPTKIEGAAVTWKPPVFHGRRPRDARRRS